LIENESNYNVRLSNNQRENVKRYYNHAREYQATERIQNN